MEGIELSGWWWLPGEEDDKVPGTLGYTNETGVVLKLLASFKKMAEVSLTASYPLILGLCEGGKLVTLSDCMETGTSLSFPGYLTQKFYARTAYIGANLQQAEHLEFATFDFQLTYLPDWLGRSGFSPRHASDNKERSSIYEVAYTYPEELKARTPKGEILVTYSLHTGGDFLRDIQLHQYVRMRVSWNEPLTFGRALDEVIRPMQNFLSLATTKPNVIESLAVVPDLGSDKDGPAAPIQVLFSQLGESTTAERRLTFTDMLFSASDIADDFQEVMTAWLTVADELDSVCNLIMGPRYQPSTYSEHRFLNAVQAAEVYHRRRKRGHVLETDEHKARVDSIMAGAPQDHVDWLVEQLEHSNEPRLKYRLDELFDEVHDVMQPLVDSKARFTRTVVDTRNYLTHYDVLRRKKAVHGADLYRLTGLVTTLVEACLIGELGITGSRRRSLFTRRRRVL